jgi:DNA-binding NarL/FixJ family response regulator
MQVEQAQPVVVDLTFTSVDEALAEALHRIEAMRAHATNADLYAELIVLHHLLAAIRQEVERNTSEIDASQIGLGQHDVPTLTPRECDVLQHMALGLRNKEIATHLSITERTVAFHVGNILAKLGADGRVEAIRSAWALGLLKLPA